VGLTPMAHGGRRVCAQLHKQHGEKGQPPSTNPVGARYWQWPYWNKESVYFVSQTRLGEVERLKLRLYHDSYDNEITSYTNGSYTTLKTSGQGSVSGGRSIYNDRTNGGAVELESFRLAAHSLRCCCQLQGRRTPGTRRQGRAHHLVQGCPVDAGCRRQHR
jgi:iron complex outermembrane receptor protein